MFSAILFKPKFEELKFVVGYDNWLSSTTALLLCEVAKIILYFIKRSILRERDETGHFIYKAQTKKPFVPIFFRKVFKIATWNLF